MCGIFGYTGKKNTAAKLVLSGLKSLEYRGYDSWGVAVVPIAKKQETRDKKQEILIKKKAGRIGDANVDDMPPSQLAFGHTRWATHGGVTTTNAHPHLSCDRQVALIHNGIIENYETIRAKLKKNGHTFMSDTDTEVAVHLIEEYSKTMEFTKAVQKAFNQMEGLNAIIAMKRGESKFVAVRNGSPLVVGFGDGENLLASDAAALLPYTKQVHYLEDGEMAIVGPSAVMLFDVRSGSHLQPKKQTLTWTVASAQKGHYEYFMLKEIHEQPGIISDIAANSTRHAGTIAREIKRADTTYLVGCGTAAYAAIAGTYIFSTIANTQVNWAIGSEFSYQLDFLTKHSLVMALSQSGETMDILEAVKAAKEKGARIAALVNVLGSTLYRQADHKLLITAGPEKGVASTKAFTGKIAHLILLAYALSGDAHGGQQALVSAAKSIQGVFKDTTINKIKKLAHSIHTSDHMYVIGRGLSYPASLETALKIKEISYIHAEGFAAGELKHGVIALIEKGTPCIVFAPDDETYSANLAGAMEMKARGGRIIGISHKKSDVFDDFIQVKDAGVATIIPNVVVGQLLGYYLTLERGFDPDMPRNLAKSVTVK